MGLIDQLAKQGSNLTQWDGSNPADMPGSKPLSELHYEYSLNGNPNFPKKPAPSQLDLDGLTPPQYLNNLPG
tara:strand:+ start:265 stop:480 length:216 start_codon:yes stop_codon:yes gene_type:complete